MFIKLRKIYKDIILCFIWSDFDRLGIMALIPNRKHSPHLVVILMKDACSFLVLMWIIHHVTMRVNAFLV